MAKTYKTGFAERTVNRLFLGMTRLGLGKAYRHVLIVRGRKTGRLHALPVDVMERDGKRWLVAAYGVQNWVRNARAAEQVTISRAGYSETLRVVDLSPEDSAPVLRQYLREVPITRAYFDVALDSAEEGYVAEALRRPVFLLEPRAPSEPARAAATEDDRA